MKKNVVDTEPYVIDALDLYAAAGSRSDGYDALVTIAGVGGTGAFLAEDLARLFSVHLGWRTRLHLTDPDRVEEHNEGRQAFSRRDRGRYKAQVVAERLIRQFPIEVSLSLAPYDHRRDAPRPHQHQERTRLALLVGCVDNAAARRELARSLQDAPPYGSSGTWWLDLGNGAASGQGYLGNCLRPRGMHGAFDPDARTCRALPAPSIQAPELLEAPTAPLPSNDEDCAEAQIAGDQEPFVNRAIAALGLAMVARLCQRKLTWRATFFDLDAGTLQYIHADPHDVANLMGLRTDRVVQRHRSSVRASA
jgi:PRTRC genetic system ThiF family protein